MNNFYLTLLSDSSLSTFSKNSQCDFKVKLDHSIQIEKENWEVDLVEVITPTEVNNITKENNYVILRFSDRKMCEEIDNCTNNGFYIDQKNYRLAKEAFNIRRNEEKQTRILVRGLDVFLQVRNDEHSAWVRREI